MKFKRAYCADKVTRSLKKIRLELANNKADKVNLEIKIIKMMVFTLSLEQNKLRVVSSPPLQRLP
jgi:hypothetical protein